ncbi:MAG: hypothetical protein CBC80_006490 [Flavobacteriaceae bacterium TMED120]|nr:MAG: hypothetical protein CBC80_006490 [Flavobacteriaceae bacterium TMED120]CAI8262848.1 MAG: Uncharacterised protein [Flavobacteriaceae bacterium]|tara:strand:+ start:1012 stop:1404 length:393 start_codon:yes stop_codon:yes gene_type:complete
MTLKRRLLNNPSKDSYFTDLEDRVFSELGIEPIRSPNRSTPYPVASWSLAASIALLIGAAWLYSLIFPTVGIDRLATDEIATFLSVDYESERYLDEAILAMGNEITLKWHEEELTNEDVTLFLNETNDNY